LWNFVIILNTLSSRNARRKFCSIGIFRLHAKDSSQQSIFC
jgi:hypothetical protein